MIRKLVLVAVVASAGAAVVRRRKNKDEVDLWHEATTAPDLR